MKKDLIFVPVLLVLAVLLCLLQFTGMTAHIIISVVGIAVLLAYTILTRKEWKIPALEIIMRAFYGITLITGVVVMNLSDLTSLAIVHKVGAILFMAALIVVLVTKLIPKKA